MSQPVAASGQTVEYVPSEELPSSGTEIVLLFFGASTLPMNQDSSFVAAIKRAKDVLAARSKSSGRHFSAVGIAIDWAPETGARYLLDGQSQYGMVYLGAWAEIHSGGNWLNDLAVRYIWSESSDPTIPQIVVLERELRVSKETMRIGSSQVIARFIGPAAIKEWALSEFRLDAPQP